MTKWLYKSLMKRKVGTNMVESEQMRLIHERLSGPMGHRLIEPGPSVNCERMTENENQSDKLVCWRDPKVVCKLLGARMKVVKTQLRKAQGYLLQR